MVNFTGYKNKNTPDAQLLFQWRVMEDLQDDQPHLRFGWWGFIPMVYE